VHGIVELLEELLVFFLAAFGGPPRRVNCA
jgi:hypothetical protein